MLEGILSDLQTHGPLGLLAAVLLVANIVQWKQAVQERADFSKERSDFGDKVQGFISVLTEINVVLRIKK